MRINKSRMVMVDIYQPAMNIFYCFDIKLQLHIYQYFIYFFTARFIRFSNKSFDKSWNTDQQS